MFLETLAGPLPGQLGFNGEVCWSTDFSGMPEQLELHDLDRNRLWIGMRTGQWLSISDSATTLAVAKTKGPRDEVVLDGRDIGWFIFDTGAAGSVLGPKVLAKGHTYEGGAD
jgi:hypothetical protein